MKLIIEAIGIIGILYLVYNWLYPKKEEIKPISDFKKKADKIGKDKEDLSNTIKIVKKEAEEAEEKLNNLNSSNNSNNSNIKKDE